MALEKAKFVNNENDETLEVQFNPSNLSIETTAMVSEQKTQQLGDDDTVTNMGGIQSRQLSVSLVVDSYQTTVSSVVGLASKNDVKSTVDKLESFMNTASDISFIWGKFIFKGYISRMTTKYEMFSSGGAPVRASLEISMDENSCEEAGVGGSSLGDSGFGLGDLVGLGEEELMSGVLSLF